ncbi:unnamed protein product [Rhodiola kirilowii]
MDALRNVYGDDHKEEALTHSPPAGSTLISENNLSTVVEEDLSEKAVVEMQPEQEMELEMTPTSKFEPEEVRDGGKAVFDASNYAASDDELSGEDLKMFDEAENDYSSDDENELPLEEKQMKLSSVGAKGEAVEESSAAAGVMINVEKKIKKKYSCVWTKPASRKGKKKAKPANVGLAAPPSLADAMCVTPLPKVLERCDDSPDMEICLSKFYKAEKVDISEDRMSAGSTKGYRMVRATRGVAEGAWYFEIKVVHLGESGHTRLGWSTEKGDLQAPVGYDAYSYGYRDIDGDKFYKALREKYGEGYREGDIIGFYINLPNGEVYAPKQLHVVLYKGQKYLCAPEEKHAISQVVPGSCISFFKNGVCQGIAYKDIIGGRYYPAASMYTLPNQPNCEVKFNFGPDFECFPSDFGDCPVPKPMVEVPYHGYDNNSTEPVVDSVKRNDAVNNA